MWGTGVIVSRAPLKTEYRKVSELESLVPYHIPERKGRAGDLQNQHYRVRVSDGTPSLRCAGEVALAYTIVLGTIRRKPSEFESLHPYQKFCQSGGVGLHSGLKTRRRKAYEFEPRDWHQVRLDG